MKAAVQRLDERGHVAYIVGGSVRDFLLGRTVKDHDLATSATPDELEELFPNSVTVGKAFGVLKIPIGETGETFEIATFREDLEYRDHRHPRGVKFSGPAEDARRRDFTINALYYDPKTARILDSVGGIADLQAKIVRAIGLPTQRFKEDALRLLRAVRFTTRLGFALDPPTSEAVKARARFITHVSSERIRDELTLMFRGPNPGRALETLAKLDLLQHALPEVDELRALERARPECEAWSHLLRMLETLDRQTPSRSFALSWAAVLHEVGRPSAWRRSKERNFNHHELDGARISAAIGERLKFTRDDSERVSKLIEDHLKFKDAFQMREATLERFVREPHFPELLSLYRADATALDGNLAFYEFCHSRFDAARASRETPRLIDGTDLIQLGLQPGPEFSQILRTIEDLALEQKLRTKEQALEYVVRHFVR